jgi:recombination protein RecA
MAKEKKEKEVETVSIDNFVERLNKEITKEFGKDIFKTAADIINRPRKIINWSPSLDAALSGGIPTGTFLSVSGPPKHAKTTCLLDLAASCQAQGMCVYYLNGECRLKEMNLKGIPGLDLSPDKFRVIESNAEKILSSQDFLGIAEKILKTNFGCFLLIDSVSSLVDAKVLDNGLGTKMMGGQNQTISQFIDLVAQVVPQTGSIVAGVIQDYANVTGYGKSFKEKAASKWTYQADISLRINRFDKWTVGSEESGKIIGQILDVEVRTSALGNPFAKCQTYHRFGYGIDKVYEVIKYAESCGFISKAGAWYKLDYLEGTEFINADGEAPKFQGGDNLWHYLSNEPKALEILNNLIKIKE